MKGPGSCGWKSTSPSNPDSTCSRMRWVSSMGAAWFDQNSTCAPAAGAVSDRATAAPANMDMCLGIFFPPLLGVPGSTFRYRRRTMAGPCDQCRPYETGERFIGSFLDDRDQHASDLACRTARMRVECREPRRGVGRGRDVVEADHRKIARDRNARARRFLHHRQRQLVEEA